jgi:hypothetical protein
VPGDIPIASASPEIASCRDVNSELAGKSRRAVAELGIEEYFRTKKMRVMTISMFNKRLNTSRDCCAPNVFEPNRL